MLTSGDVLAMRHTVERTLPDICTIQRATTISDGGGGVTEGWDDLATIACRISPTSAGGGEGQNTTSARVVDETTHVVTVPATEDITEADRLMVAGQVYEITLVRKRGAWEITRRIEVREAP